MLLRVALARLRTVGTVPQQWANVACVANSAYTTATAARSGVGQAAADNEDARPGMSGSCATASAASGSGRSSSTALVPRRTESLLQRSLTTALNAIHRLVLLVGSIRRMSANEAYVAHYLEKNVGFDSFTLEYLLVSRPGLFHLSVARDIEPVISWLRSIGISGQALVELVRHTPTVLSCSVDDQLEPLAEFVAAAGGSAGQVLQAYPGLMAVPVAALKGTRHVLRQLGVTESNISMLLLCLPDLYEHLALTLQQLFTDYAVAGWKIHARQRVQLSGMVHHHMAHWNRDRRTAAPAHAAGSGSGPSSDSEDEEAAAAATGAHRHPHLHPHLHPQRSRIQREPDSGDSGGHGGSSGYLLNTSYILDREVYRRLMRMQAALEVIPLLPDGEERDVAISHLEHAIDQLAQLAVAGSSRRDMRLPTLQQATALG